MRVDFHLSKRVPPIKANPEVYFRLYGRHLENRYDVITSPPIVWLRRKLAAKWCMKVTQNILWKWTFLMKAEIVGSS